MLFQSWFRRRRTSLAERVADALTLLRRGDPHGAFPLIAGQYPEALEELQALGESVDTGWLQLAAYLQFRSGEMAAAARSAERALARADEPLIWNLLGRIRVWLQRGDAQAAFVRAAGLDPKRFAVPHRVSRDHFAELADAALAEIPEQFQSMLSNTLIVVEDLPELAAVRGGEDPDLLGFYEGATVLERGLPERILLYQRNHENVSPDEDELIEQVHETMRHEVGHHFGMEEDELPY